MLASGFPALPAEPLPQTRLRHASTLPPKVRSHREREELLSRSEGALREAQHCAAHCVAPRRVVRSARALVVLLVDLLDASGSLLGRVRELVGGNPIVLIGGWVGVSGWAGRRVDGRVHRRVHGWAGRPGAQCFLCADMGPKCCAGPGGVAKLGRAGLLELRAAAAGGACGSCWLPCAGWGFCLPSSSARCALGVPHAIKPPSHPQLRKHPPWLRMPLPPAESAVHAALCTLCKAGTKADLLPEGADEGEVADWLAAAAAFKRVNAISVHLVRAFLAALVCI